MRAVQIGCGLVGHVIASDLAQEYAFVMAEQKRRGLIYRETTTTVRDAR